MPGYKQRKQKLKELVKKQEEERILKIKQEGHQFNDTNAFKRAEKHYKSYAHKQTDFSKMVDLQSLQSFNINGKTVYKIEEPKGAYLIKKFIPVQQQYQIGFEALNRYIYRPYRTNLDGTNGLQDKDEEGKVVMDQNIQVEPQQIKNEKGQTLYYFNDKIRMCNLGYQYDWPNRCYPSGKVSVPKRVSNLTKKAIEIFQEISKIKMDYCGQAVIVNYYKNKDYMIGHLDDGQIDQQSPIFSFCFGLSCVFLLGFPQKEREPIAIQLQAGDLMIMSGYSRICYHGVPRVIQNSYKCQEHNNFEFDLKVPVEQKQYKYLNQKQQIKNYFMTHRLNINIRQIYPSKKEQLQKVQN